MTSLVHRLSSAIRAFREEFLTPNMEGLDRKDVLHDFDSYEGRLTRYDILWGYYVGSPYSELRTWARSMKNKYDLYTHIRSIYNPANRIINFHRTHIWNGYLDLEAGDGSRIASAIPIRDASDAMRRSLGQLWRSSRFPLLKVQIPLRGAIFGDVFVKVITEGNEVLLDVVHPSWVADLRKNVLGEITEYTLVYYREDPDKRGNYVQYTEKAVLEDVGIIYQTFRDDQPYAWDGNPEEWVVPYPFIPLVHIQHDDVGIDWGWSELFPNLSKFREADDQASKLGDQIRKMVDSPWFFAGVKQGKRESGNLTIVSQETSDPLKTALGREEVPIIYAHDSAAKPYPLVTTSMDLGASLKNVAEILSEIERAYPELRAAGLPSRLGRGDVSGRALLLAQQEAVDKVAMRRVNYDDQLTRVQRYAVAIGGELGYDGYEGFSIEDYNTDATLHRIEDRRPVYRPHTTEVASEEQALWVNANLAQRAGVALDVFLRERGWEEDRIQSIISTDYYQRFLEGQQQEGSTGNLPGISSPDNEQEGEVDFNVDELQDRVG